MTPDTVREALTQHRDAEAGVHQYDDLASAAQRWVDLLDRLAVPCETCEGNGDVAAGVDIHADHPHLDPCPDCVNGLVPHPDRTERVARIMFDAGLTPDDVENWDTVPDWVRDEYRDYAAAALLADLRHLLGDEK